MKNWIIFGIVFLLIVVISCAKPENDLKQEYLLPSDFKARATMGGNTDFGLQGYIDTESLNKMVKQEFSYSKEYSFFVYEKKTNVKVEVSILDYYLNYESYIILDSITRLNIFNKLKEYNINNYIYVNGFVIYSEGPMHIDFNSGYGNSKYGLGLSNPDYITFTNK